MNNKFQAIEKASKGEITIEMRPVYIINGAKRAYLSERAALNKLSSILTEREFREEGIETNYEDESVTLENGIIAHKRGEPTEHFMERKEAKYAELSERLKKEREIKRLEMEYEKAKDKCKDADIVANEVYKKLIAAQNL
ncbi:hypothetical protein J9231_11340 [Providencia rettgeri]|uniref:hypothetical protein n=1 Tax=Providencia rettgeri TaxID=587 RepID=UPI001B37D557|nr:hypothetical protein [Providencia rettgeri]MBQ0328442.1 hypothetical protein [Providencia rettgeri]